MPKTLPRKALISISSFSGAIYPGGLKTGLFYTEALHPFEVLTDAGFEVDLASETGTCGIDEVSLMLQFLSGSDKAVFGDPKHPFNVKLHSRLKKASELKSEDYGLFFASAGHAALYDYPIGSHVEQRVCFDSLNAPDSHQMPLIRISQEATGVPRSCQ